MQPQDTVAAAAWLLAAISRADTISGMNALVRGTLASQVPMRPGTAEKRIEYATAGIPHYWIVRMAQQDGPAVSVERLRLTSDRHYALEQITFRGQDHLAVQTIDPLELTLSWEQLDEWL